MKTKCGVWRVGGEEVLGPAPACSLFGVSVSVKLHGSKLVDSVNLLVVSMTSLAHSILSSTLPQDFPSSAHCLAMGLHICFQQLLDEASQKTVMLGSYQAQQSFTNDSQAGLELTDILLPPASTFPGIKGVQYYHLAVQRILN